MKLALRIVKYLAFAAYGVAGILLIVFLLPQTGWKALAVKTGSMTPAIPTGSLVIVHREPLHSLQVGDVITYTDPADTQITITHRIVKTETKKGLPYFVTKGDANATADPEIIGGVVVGQVVWHVPVLGKLIGGVRTLPGVLIIVVIPGLFIIQQEFRKMRQAWKQPLEEAQKTPAAPAPHKPQVAAQTVSAPTRRRSMDGVRHLISIVIVGGIILGVGTTFSAWQATAILKHNTFTTFASPTPSPTSSSTCINIVNVNNSSTQTASSGNANSNNNTNTGTTNSGNASNSNNTTTTVTNGC